MAHLRDAIAAGLLLPGAAAGSWQSALELDAGYRQDDLVWSIAGSSDGPNVLSELAFERIEIVEIGAGLELRSPTGLEAHLGLRVGEIVDGGVRDSDYSGDDRSLEWSRSENAVEDDDVWDASAGIGWAFDWVDPESGRAARLVPMVGYAVSEQALRMSEGNQTVSEPALAPPGFSPQPLGPFPGLDSTYETEWMGPWVGLHGLFQASASWSAGLAVEYHWFDYEAVADWNLREDFQHPRSFEHEAEGEGWRLALKGTRRLGPRSDLTVGLRLRNFETDAGVDRVFLSDDPSLPPELRNQVLETRLNGVDWESWSLSLGWRLRF